MKRPKYPDLTVKTKITNEEADRLLKASRAGRKPNPLANVQAKIQRPRSLSG